VTDVESHNAIGLCERYHPIIRRVYRKVRSDHPTLAPDLILSIAVHAVNSTVGPDGITPSLLVFGTVPKLPIAHLETISPTQKERFQAMKSAKEEMLAITAHRRVKDALRRGPSAQLFIPEEGDKVYVYRENSNQYEGLYEVHSYDQRKTVNLLIPEAGGRRIRVKPFALSKLKPYHEDPVPTEMEPNDDNQPHHTPLPQDPQPQGLLEDRNDIDADLRAIDAAMDDLRTNVTPSYPVAIVDDPNDPSFDEAKTTELRLLLAKGTYKFVHKEDVPKDAVVMESRFVLTIKEPDSTSPQFKARFVILGHKDPDKHRIVNEAPTVLRSSVRLLISLSRVYNYPLWNRDVSQAFVQSRDELKRDVYVKVPKGQRVLETLGAPPGSLLKAVKPQYGLIESPTYWWVTFGGFHRDDLDLEQTVMDPCLFYKCEPHDPNDEVPPLEEVQEREKVEGQGFIGAQALLVDDTLGTGNEDFSESERKIGISFETKPRCDTLPIKFNGVNIEWYPIDGERISPVRMQQLQYASTVKKVSSSCTAEEFATLRGKIAYLASSTRPDLSFYAARLAHCNAK